MGRRSTASRLGVDSPNKALERERCLRGRQRCSPHDPGKVGIPQGDDSFAEGHRIAWWDKDPGLRGDVVLCTHSSGGDHRST